MSGLEWTEDILLKSFVCGSAKRKDNTMTFHQAAFKMEATGHTNYVFQEVSHQVKIVLKERFWLHLIVEVLFIHGNRGSFLSGVSPDDPKIIPGRL